MTKKKYYVVWNGLTPGVYDSWDACKQQVAGVKGARYKAFDTYTAALEASGRDYRSFVKSKVIPAVSKPTKQTIILDSVAVDAACSGNPGEMEYQGVYVQTGERLFHMGPLPEGTNNIGEFLGIVHALALLKKQGLESLPIYSDSRNAILWVKGGACRTKLVETERNRPIFVLIKRAESWLMENKLTNPILKWETASWGEIPADFGRK
jgi:ribonuclease HI